jgi:hypothetical protein
MTSLFPFGCLHQLAVMTSWFAGHKVVFFLSREHRVVVFGKFESKSDGFMLLTLSWSIDSGSRFHNGILLLPIFLFVCLRLTKRK